MSSYQIYQFDGVALPLYGQTQDLGTGKVGSSLVASAGGMFDWASSWRRLPLSAQSTISGMYAAEVDGDGLVDQAGNRLIAAAGTYLITHSAHADLRAQVDAIKAKIGVRGTLRRRRFDDESVTQWRTARMLDVRENGESEERGVRAALDCLFEATMPWRSAAQSSASLRADALVEVLGTLPVRRAATLTITASATITQVTVANAMTGVAWTWTGTVAAGQSLIIDDEAQTVLLAGADAYSGFSLSSGHTAKSWLELAPGAQSVVVSIFGTASAVTLAWWDVWG